MSNVIRYSVVRFRPFMETGEFANIGIVAIDLGRGKLFWKLAPRRLGRVTQFFKDIDAMVYSNTVEVLREEFKRIAAERGTNMLSLFDHLVQARESTVLFSEPRAAFVTSGVDRYVQELYARNVMRSFVTPEYRETLVARNLRSELKRHHITGYKQLRIEDDLISVSFDLGSETNGTRVIKALAFPHKTTMGIIDHGALWQNRLAHLLRKKRLKVENVLLPVDYAVDLTEPLASEARDEALYGLHTLDVQIIDKDDTAALIQFAQPGSTSTVDLHRE